MAVGLQRTGDWPAARRIGRCAAQPANHRCAVGLLPLPREQFRLLKLILHSELRRRAAWRRALPSSSSWSSWSASSSSATTSLIFIDENNATYVTTGADTPLNYSAISSYPESSVMSHSNPGNFHLCTKSSSHHQPGDLLAIVALR